MVASVSSLKVSSQPPHPQPTELKQLHSLYVIGNGFVFSQEINIWNILFCSEMCRCYSEPEMSHTEAKDGCFYWVMLHEMYITSNGILHPKRSSLEIQAVLCGTVYGTHHHGLGRFLANDPVRSPATISLLVMDRVTCVLQCFTPLLMFWEDKLLHWQEVGAKRVPWGLFAKALYIHGIQKYWFWHAQRQEHWQTRYLNIIDCICLGWVELDLCASWKQTVCPMCWHKNPSWEQTQSCTCRGRCMHSDMQRDSVLVIMALLLAATCKKSSDASSDLELRPEITFFALWLLFLLQ